MSCYLGRNVVGNSEHSFSLLKFKEQLRVTPMYIKESNSKNSKRTFVAKLIG
jgi:hypothetical protein